MRFMATSLTKRVENLSEGIHKIKCKDCGCYLKYGSVKNNLVKYKCLPCNKNYSEILNEDLKNKFKNTFTFSNNDINKSTLLLRKGVCPCDYMNDWERFDEISLPEKEKFCNKVNMEDIADVDYAHIQEFIKTLEENIKSLGEYHDLYLKSDVLLLADVFENFREMSLEIYGLGPAKLFRSSA